jgi:hypothetical protein
LNDPNHDSFGYLRAAGLELKPIHLMLLAVYPIAERPRVKRGLKPS